MKTELPSIPKKARWKKLVSELLTIIRYGLVGAVNTALTVVVMWILSKVGISYRLYSPIAYGLGIICSFILNFRFTFRIKHTKYLRTLVLFLAVCLSLTLISQIIQNWLIETVNFKKVFGIGIGMVFYTGVGYIVNRCFVFKNKGKKEGAEAHL